MKLNNHFKINRISLHYPSRLIIGYNMSIIIRVIAFQQGFKLYNLDFIALNCIMKIINCVELSRAIIKCQLFSELWLSD